MCGSCTRDTWHRTQCTSRATGATWPRAVKTPRPAPLPLQWRRSLGLVTCENTHSMSAHTSTVLQSTYLLTSRHSSHLNKPSTLRWAAPGVGWLDLLLLLCTMGETRILTPFNPFIQGFILEYFLGLARNRVTIIFSLFVKCAPSPIFPSYSELSQFIGVETPDRCPASFFMLPLLCICVIIPHEIFVKCQNTKLYFILIIRILVETCRHIKTSTLYYDTSTPVTSIKQDPD